MTLYGKGIQRRKVFLGSAGLTGLAAVGMTWVRILSIMGAIALAYPLSRPTLFSNSFRTVNSFRAIDHLVAARTL